jgi:integrase
LAHELAHNVGVAKAGRRGNGEGTITQRSDGLWVARASLPDGTRKAVSARTRAEVVRKLTAVHRAIAQGLPLPAERETFGSFTSGWLDGQRGVLRQSTVDTYRRHLAHAKPLAKTRLARLGPADLQRLYANLLDEGLSAMTVRHVHAVIHRALEQAAVWGRVPRNVASLVKPPTAERTRMATLTADEARRLLQAASGDPLEALYVLALTTGMRRGELLALRWPDVDLDAATLQVTGGLVRDSTGRRVGEPKTARSRRRVELGAIAVEALRRHRAATASVGFVFASEKGTPLEPGNVLRRSFWPLLERAGLPRVRLHDLRHTAATLHLAMGTHPKVVADLLGHASIAITLDTYSHAVPGIAQQAAADMDALLRG